MDINSIINEPMANLGEGNDFTPRFPESIDSTIRSVYRSCPWKCFQTHMRGVSSPYRNENLEFGGVFAEGCKTTRNAFYRDGKATGEASFLG